MIEQQPLGRIQVFTGIQKLASGKTVLKIFTATFRQNPCNGQRGTGFGDVIGTGSFPSEKAGAVQVKYNDTIDSQIGKKKTVSYKI